MTINTSIKIKLLSKRITLQLNKKGYHELNSTITANNFIKEKEKKNNLHNSQRCNTIHKENLT